MYQIAIVGRAQTNPQLAAGWSCRILGSGDGSTWTELGNTAGADRPAANFATTLPLTAPSHNRYYRLEFEAASVTTWQIAEVRLFDHNERIRMAGPFHFDGAWTSAGSADEWVYVDLGAPCTFDRILPAL